MQGREIMRKIDSFYELARNFCDYVQKNEISYDSVDYLITTVMRLYIAVQELPEIEPETEGIAKGAGIPFIRLGKDFPEEYLEVFDPFNDIEMVYGHVLDDLQDIVKDLYRGISEYEAGRIGNARFEWHFGMITHWGQHAVDLIKALHSLHTKQDNL